MTTHKMKNWSIRSANTPKLRWAGIKVPIFSSRIEAMTKNRSLALRCSIRTVRLAAMTLQRRPKIWIGLRPRRMEGKLSRSCATLCKKLPRTTSSRSASSLTESCQSQTQFICVETWRRITQRIRTKIIDTCARPWLFWKTQTRIWLNASRLKQSFPVVSIRTRTVLPQALLCGAWKIRTNKRTNQLSTWARLRLTAHQRGSGCLR